MRPDRAFGPARERAWAALLGAVGAAVAFGVHFGSPAFGLGVFAVLVFVSAQFGGRRP